ncbi:MAG: hypothetical protein CL678_00905 [Bdellovibrionaceae bacterium]|nr:hypothetical protein [Pseudobdellovibrionaceae bacterium]
MSDCSDTCRYGQNSLLHMAAKLIEKTAPCESYAAAVVQYAPSECFAGTTIPDYSACSFKLDFPQCHFHAWPSAAIAFAGAFASLAVLLPTTIVFFQALKQTQRRL